MHSGLCWKYVVPSIPGWGIRRPRLPTLNKKPLPSKLGSVSFKVVITGHYAGYTSFSGINISKQI